MSWAATTRLMAEGKSFSGRERNAFFLNVGGGRFADVSGISGFDFLDDARALCTVDWDFDGALDFWACNRTGPRLRLMRNASGHPAGSAANAPAAHWVALRLRGVTCNRDAVGARVEVTTPSGTLMRTLRAGEGFLSQSSKWLHFGLGEDARISGVSVWWPGAAEPERIQALAAGRFHVIEQGSGVAAPWTPPAAASVLAPADQQVLPVAETARIVLAARPPLPPVPELEPPVSGEPMLLNVWATWCGPCIEELSAFTARAEEFRRKNLNVVLLNADDPGEPDREARVVATLGRLQGSEAPVMVSRLPDARVLRILDAFQRALTQRQRPLPLPASFLIDAEGRVAVVYKGKVDVETVLADCETLATGPGSWRDQATPFPGQWLSRPPQSNPLRIAMKLLDLDEPELGAAYLQRFLEREGAAIEPAGALADVHFALGRARAMADDRAGAAAAYQSAIKADPRYRKAYVELGHLLLDNRSFEAADRLLARAVQLDRSDADAVVLDAMARLGMRRFEDVEKLCRYALTLQPNHTTALYNLAFALQQMDRHRDAVNHYARLLDSTPGQAMAANNLAWILSTSPDATVRDGPRAVSIARQLCDSEAGAAQPIFWMTLAAAHGEAGDFADAVTAVARAIGLTADVREGSTLPATLRRHLALYQQGEAVRD